MAKITRFIILVLLNVWLVACGVINKAPKPPRKIPASFDVVVYGATPGGIAAAIMASREGASVALLAPTKHIGGMVTSGLGRSDIGKPEVVGGFADEFFRKVGEEYDRDRALYNFEPHKATQAFDKLLDESSVFVFRNVPLRSVVRNGTVIRSVTAGNKEFSGKVFIDASYEGDLMAQSGVSYTVGRESIAKYGEPFAGFQVGGKWEVFNTHVPGKSKNGKLLLGINPDGWTDIGVGDKKVMAYCFRLCLTKREDNRVIIPKPKDYRVERYEMLARYISMNPGISVRRLIYFLDIPNDKVDLNTRGAFSTDYIGRNWNYPEGNEQDRMRIWKKHKRYTEGLLYFLANDRRVWPRIRSEMKEWGLCKDEFVDNGHWPPELYVREARRMIGEYVLLQKDLTDDFKKPDSVGRGSMNIESHHVQRVLNDKGVIVNEGAINHPVERYAIPYRSLVPRRNEVTNLLNPVTVSASHVAYTSLRMEPVYMILGHSAGVAAAMTAKTNKPVQQVDIKALKKKLRSQKQVL